MTQQQQEEKVQHPSRADRQKCWKVRDAFFACLDQSNVVDPSSPEAANICRVLEVEQKEMLERMRAQHKAAEDRAAETAKAKTPKAA
ncbi:hypothetical protein BX616_010796 [Lobosporangium transversale]|nr:hypothetical protein BX616_010796 [Lobosporangium transversale]